MDWGFIEKYRQLEPPWGPIGLITYARTYSRDGEDWCATLERACKGLVDIGGRLTQREIEDIFDYAFHMKISFSGRALWQLGTPNIKKVGPNSLMNCWHVAVNSLEVFGFVFNELMLGGGVGFNITPEQVYALPKVAHNPIIEREDSNDVDFIVPDNREGWVKLLDHVLEAFFHTGKKFTFSTLCIRPKGQPIKTFGGIASGSENLVDGIFKIVGVLRNRVNQKLRPIDCLDILNLIGSIVVSGNVRRSAQIAQGSPDDADFLGAKDWSKHPVPYWRACSNNTVLVSDMSQLPETFWDGYQGNGESYGLTNLNNCRRFGRVADGPGLYDPDVTGTNPCGEITLAPYEPCNLGEIFLPMLKTKDEFYKAAELIYKVCKTISAINFKNPKVQSVVERNRRLGISISGYLQKPDWVGDDELFSGVYQHIRQIDKDYSKLLGVAPSIKLTTVKPSGTLSLLPGVTPGVHPAFSQFYIRRIQFGEDNPLVGVCKAAGFKVEPKINIDGTRDFSTMIVEFPCTVPEGTAIAADLDAVSQLEHVKFLQSYWADNSVSVTVYFKKEELPAIREWLAKNYATSLKTVSFLLHSEHGFQQAPYEEITEAEYLELHNRTTPIRRITSRGEPLDNLECPNGACPIR